MPRRCIQAGLGAMPWVRARPAFMGQGHTGGGAPSFFFGSGGA